MSSQTIQCPVKRYHRAFRAQPSFPSHVCFAVPLRPHSLLCRYSAALDLDPSMLPALNNRALALLKLGCYEEAERDCTQASEV